MKIIIQGEVKGKRGPGKPRPHHKIFFDQVKEKANRCHVVLGCINCSRRSTSQEFTPPIRATLLYNE